MDAPKISIVIPSFNQGKYIERTIKSIVQQEYPNLELILMDGGSSDETMDIVDRYRGYFSYIRSEKDGGQSDAIASGFEQATGDYVTWLNSDDTYSAGSLNAVGRFLSTNPDVDFAYGNANYIDQDDRIITRKRSIRPVNGVIKYAFLTVPQMSAFWRRSLNDQVGSIDRSLRFCMDYDLFVRLVESTRARYIDLDIGNFRLHPESKTKNLEAIRLAEDDLVRMRYCRFKPGTLAHQIVKGFWTVVVIAMFVANGSIVERAGRRLRNRWKSEAG